MIQNKWEIGRGGSPVWDLEWILSYITTKDYKCLVITNKKIKLRTKSCIDIDSIQFPPWKLSKCFSAIPTKWNARRQRGHPAQTFIILESSQDHFLVFSILSHQGPDITTISIPFHYLETKSLRVWPLFWESWKLNQRVNSRDALQTWPVLIFSHYCFFISFCLNWYSSERIVFFWWSDGKVPLQRWLWVLAIIWFHCIPRMVALEGGCRKTLFLIIRFRVHLPIQK